MDSRHDQLSVVGGSDGEESAVSEFVGVMRRLKEVIQEENHLLSRGLPASLLSTTELKRKLAKEYGARGGHLTDHASGQIIGDAALQEKLVAASAQLLAMSEENRNLLSSALDSTRRRVDKVMEAIRTHDEAQGNGEDWPPLLPR